MTNQLASNSFLNKGLEYANVCQAMALSLSSKNFVERTLLSYFAVFVLYLEILWMQGLIRITYKAS